MEGLRVFGQSEYLLQAGVGNSKLRLLSTSGEAEIMVQRIAATATVWLLPAEDPRAVEFFFVHTGRVELLLSDGARVLNPGESFRLEGLKTETLIKAHTDSELLYVSDRPVFAAAEAFQQDLEGLIEQIDAKDHYTMRHSRNVMRISARLYECLGAKGVSVNDMLVAALFHDVGKCYVPDEILRRPDRLGPGDTRFIARHPIDGGRLVRPKYGDTVAEIVRAHHERLDGSGYPFGMQRDDIRLESRIIAVADVYDAMTGGRCYSAPKTPQEAAAELCRLKRQFDPQVTGVLKELVAGEREGIIAG